MPQKERIKIAEQKLAEAGFKIKYRTPGELQLHKCSLHSDKTPSLSVNVEKGKYKCWSCGDGGGISRLLSYYGIKYGNYYEVPTIDELESLLDFGLDVSTKNFAEKYSSEIKEYRADINDLKNYRYYHPYMESRGLTKEFILKNKIGFDTHSLRVTIPIFQDGIYYGCARRSVTGDIPKICYDQGMPKNELIYSPLSNSGLSKYLVVSEGPIDALKGTFLGQDTIAILGCKLSEKQLELIEKQSSGRDIIWALDDDSPGKAGMDRAINMLEMVDKHFRFVYSDGVKDLGECDQKQFNYGIENAKSVWDF